MLISWPDEVSRPSESCGRARSFFDCLADLRPSERSEVEMKPAKLERSGVERAESGESVIGRGRNRADAWRREWVRRSRLSLTKHKCRLGEATGKKLKC